VVKGSGIHWPPVASPAMLASYINRSYNQKYLFLAKYSYVN